MKSVSKSIPSLVVFTILVAGAAVIGSMSNTDLWFRNLEKPPLNPPDWLFGPVWTTLYILIIIAAWLVWRTETYQKTKRLAIGFFGAQLLLNALWSWIFFTLHNPGLALVDIILLNVAIMGMIGWYGRINRTAAWLMVPYLLWVGFATYLNWAIWTLN